MIIHAFLFVFSKLGYCTCVLAVWFALFSFLIFDGFNELVYVHRCVRVKIKREKKEE